ncbi:hypothetical protein MKW98_025284 [Papaver atlanticum]|uniref:Uncharacterized protein n=1 Tax=Papaver atlanticum TaxID=357466 RepID=A0AAD4S253_9MAGN|nr:hypothetical protein MKW98_025284 [Papaver atlanticum]
MVEISQGPSYIIMINKLLFFLSPATTKKKPWQLSGVQLRYNLYIRVFGRTTPAFRKIKERIESATTWWKAATTNESPPIVTNRRARTKRILPTTKRKIRKNS